jgi:hypothetical protein
MLPNAYRYRSARNDLSLLPSGSSNATTREDTECKGCQLGALYDVKNALSLDACGHTVDEEIKRFDIGRACRVESLDRLKAL